MRAGGFELRDSVGQEFEAVVEGLLVSGVELREVTTDGGAVGGGESGLADGVVDGGGDNIRKGFDVKILEFGEC